MVSTLKPGIVMETSEVFETSDLPESDQYYFPGRFNNQGWFGRWCIYVDIS